MNILNEVERTANYSAVLIIIPMEKFQETIVNTLRTMLKDDLSGIYVTFSKPYKFLEKILKDENIDVSKLYFIDCISRSTTDLEKERDVLYVNNRGNLNSLGIAITQSNKSQPNKNFLFIDAIETLLIYNKIETIAIFIQSLIKKASDYGLKLVILTSGKDVRLLNRISLFFDKIIEVK